MLRKVVLTASAAALALGSLATFAPPAFAGKVALGNATGTVSCNITGKVKISPALSEINTQPSTTTAKTKSTSCTASGGTIGAHPVTKSKGLATSTGSSPGTCTGLLAAGTSPFSVSVTWKAAGASLNPSSITYANDGPSGLGFDLPSTGAAGAATSVVTGSFGGEKSWAHADIDAGPILTALADVGPTATGKGCGANAKGKAKGIKKITITGGHINIFP
ncbi:MAG: hypothetical protein ACXVKA_13605 [Acidimicrobiia bacterium]